MVDPLQISIRLSDEIMVPFPKAEGKFRVKFCVQIYFSLKILLHLSSLVNGSSVLVPHIVSGQRYYSF